MAVLAAYNWATDPPPLTLTLIFKSLNLSTPKINIGSKILTLKVFGSMFWIGILLTVIVPFPSCITAFAIPFLFFPWAIYHF